MGITETILDFMITNTPAIVITLYGHIYEQLDESTLEKIWKNNSLLPYSRSSSIPTCHIGMTEEKFNEIPIIPTSQFNKQELERMEQVGHGYWLDLHAHQMLPKVTSSRLSCMHGFRYTIAAIIRYLLKS